MKVKKVLWCIDNIGIASHHIVTLNFDIEIAQMQVSRDRTLWTLYTHLEIYGIYQKQNTLVQWSHRSLSLMFEYVVLTSISQK